MLALQKVKLGPDHPHTLSTMNNLATTYYALGRHADSRHRRRMATVSKRCDVVPVALARPDSGRVLSAREGTRIIRR